MRPSFEDIRRVARTRLVGGLPRLPMVVYPKYDFGINDKRYKHLTERRSI